MKLLKRCSRYLLTFVNYVLISLLVSNVFLLALIYLDANDSFPINPVWYGSKSCIKIIMILHSMSLLLSTCAALAKQVTSERD